MKNIYKIALAILLALPTVTFAVPVSVDRLNGNHIEPLIKTDYIKASYLVASSTTATSTFANGIDLSGGCFAIAGTCLGGGSSQWTTSGSDIYYNTGDVGIGTVAPQNLLEVSDTSAGATLGLLRLSNIGVGTSTGSRLLFTTKDSGNFNLSSTIDSIATDITTAKGKSDLVFSVTNIGSLVERMRILSSGNVGIGSTTPVSQLTVQKTIVSDVDYPALALSRDDTSNTLGDSLGDIDFWSNDISTDGPGIGSRIRGVVDDVAGRSYGLSLWTRSGGAGTPISEKMRIASDGKVGIGTTNPESKLQIGAPHTGENIGSVPVMRILGSALDTTPQTMLRLNRIFNQNSFYSGGADFNIKSYGVSGTPFLPKTQLDIALKSTAGQTETADVIVMSLRDNGNVGIGTTTPRSKLQISESGSAILTLHRVDSAINPADEYGSIDWYTNDTQLTGGASVATYIKSVAPSDISSYNTANPYGELQFGVSNNTAVATAMTLSRAGNLGIGTTSPYMNLSVVGRTKLGYHTLCGDSQPLASSTGSVLLECWGNSAYNVEMGVGNRSNANTAYTDIFLNNDLADSSITHYGSIYLNSSTYNDATYGTGQAFPNQMGIQNTDGLLSLFSSTSTASRNGINFYVGGTNTTNEIARITTTGLGIGTSSPYEKLAIAESAPTIVLSSTNTVISGGATYGDIDFTTDDPSGAGLVARIRAKGVDNNFGGDSDLTFWTRQGGQQMLEKLRLTAFGRLGLGTTSPSAFLHVTNIGSVASFLVEDSASIDTTPFIIDASGNTGIGTSTPNDKLSVYGGGIGINPGGASRPTCAADTRGDIWNTFGGAGVADTFAVCQKDSADVYAWVTK